MELSSEVQDPKNEIHIHAYTNSSPLTEIITVSKEVTTIHCCRYQVINDISVRN